MTRVTTIVEMCGPKASVSQLSASCQTMAV